MTSGGFNQTFRATICTFLKFLYDTMIMVAEATEASWEIYNILHAICRDSFTFWSILRTIWATKT